MCQITQTETCSVIFKINDFPVFQEYVISVGTQSGKAPTLVPAAVLVAGTPERAAQASPAVPARCKVISWIQDRGSRIQGPGSRIPAHWIMCPLQFELRDKM